MVYSSEKESTWTVKVSTRRWNEELSELRESGKASALSDVACKSEWINVQKL